MAAISGQEGKISVGSQDVALITSWDLNLDAATQEITNFSSNGFREYAAIGLIGASASVEGYLDSTAGALGVGDSVTVDLYLDDTDKYSGTAVIKSVKVKNSATDLIAVSYDLEFTGTITEPTAPIS
jgi:hypothetical protein